MERRDTKGKIEEQWEQELFSWKDIAGDFPILAISLEGVPRGKEVLEVLIEDRRPPAWKIKFLGK